MRLGRLRGVTRLIMAAAVAAVALFAAGTASAAKSGSTLATFNTPGAYRWTVPNGVKQVTFDLFGAQGGSGGAQLGSPGEDIEGAFLFLDIGREWIVRGFTSLTTKDMHKVWRRKN